MLPRNPDAPLPPDILADARTDRVHVDIGHGRAVTPTRAPLPREPEPRPPTREEIEAADRREDEAIGAGIEKRRRQPKTPAPASVRGLRWG